MAHQLLAYGQFCGNVCAEDGLAAENVRQGASFPAHFLVCRSPSWFRRFSKTLTVYEIGHGELDTKIFL